MFRTLLLGRPFGIGTYVHWSFWLLLLYVAFQAMQFGMAAVVASVLMVCAVFGCVVLHELGHALMARRFGIRTHDIYLYPIGGVARLERMPENPVQELLIALAGPAVNVVIAAILFTFLGFNRIMLPTEDALMQVPPGLLGQVHLLALVNVGLVLFNLLPAFPMDGGRVLRALLGLKFSYLRATELAATVGKYMALLLAFYGLVNGQFLLVILAAFVYLSGQQERLMVRMRYSPGFNSRQHGFFDDRGFGNSDPFQRHASDRYYQEPPDVIDVTPTRKY
jgi:Zn-dependent protease